MHAGRKLGVSKGANMNDSTNDQAPMTGSQRWMQEWCALLDGELSDEQADNLRDVIAEDEELTRAFKSQRLFDQTLKRMLCERFSSEGLPDSCLQGIRAALQDVDDEQLARNTRTIPQLAGNVGLQQRKPSRTTIRSIRAQASVPVRGRVYAITSKFRTGPGIAALFLFTLGLGLMLGALWQPFESAQVAPPSNRVDAGISTTTLVKINTDLPEHTRTLLHGLVAHGNDMILRLGSGRLEDVEAQSVAVGFQNSLPNERQYPRWHEHKMVPANVSVGEIDGLRFEAVCFCTGNVGDDIENYGIKSSGPVLRRCVLFILEGDQLAEFKPQDGSAFAVLDAMNFTAICKYDPKLNKTCLVYTPIASSAEEAKELAAPLLIHSDDSSDLSEG